MTRPLAFVTLSLLLLAGCRDREITAYRAPKDPIAPPAAGAPSAGALSPAEGHSDNDGHNHASTPSGVEGRKVEGLTWTVPASWQEQPAASMRVATYLATAPDGRKAELIISKFPGDVGGDLANVNRWRNQVQLPPIGQAELAAAIQTRDFPAGTFKLSDFTSDALIVDGKFKDRLLGAWIKVDGQTWFFKFRGEAAWVASQSDTFFAFLNSIKSSPSTPSGVEGSPAEGPSMPPSMASTAPDGQAIPRVEAPSGFTWTAPAAWKAKPLGQMRQGSYDVPGASGAPADLSITVLAGEAGGLLENINRWRGQLSQPPVAPTALATESTFLVAGEHRFTIVDFTGAGPKAGTRLLGAITTVDDRSYFFKLVGSDATVSGAKPAFLEFLNTVHIH